jgi:GNAT superfamily N-acetyltransferase
MSAFDVRPISESDRQWIASLLESRWGSAAIVSLGRLHQAGSLPGFVALADGSPVGVVTFDVRSDQCEIVTLDSILEGRGVGSGLIDAVRAAAVSGGCRRLWLVTSNDNMHALRFYQRRGFELVALRRGAIEEARALKPGIPRYGMDGIPLRDEIELELILEPDARRETTQ